MTITTRGCIFAAAYAAAFTLTQGEPVTVGWLGGTPPPLSSGVSWGVPFAPGTVKPAQTFTLTTAGGQALPVQAWPLAYWPDGSLKWSGLATVAGPDAVGPLTLSPGIAPAAAVAVSVQQKGVTTEIDTGKLKCRITQGGANLIDTLVIDGREVARQGQLVCVLQDGPDGGADEARPRERFGTKLEKVTVEQSGPVRAVVKLEGKHQGLKSSRAWLPFVVRLYFYAGQEAVRVVHTFVFDGDEQKDFIRGLGLTFAVPMREEVQNRHVRFSGQDGGLWAEPIQPGAGNPEQVAGKAIAKGRYNGAEGDYAIWSDFKLTQLSPDGFTVVKRTNPQSTWISAGAGRRASGLAFVGDVSGGLAISVKDFWQSYPAGLEVQQAAGATAQLTAWLWTPEAPAMDLRHYDTKAHGLNASYEDVQPGLSTPFGVARTSELTLYPTGTMPTKPATVAMAESGAKLPLLAAAPAHLHATGVFGVWSLPDRSTPFKAAIEDRLDNMLAFYRQQVDERSWYGFWYFGDYIHSYNAASHVWYYDFGGHAWDNTELGTPLWLWYSFLRTGRADVFRMAEALTRNTSETCVYHLGPMAGLGSRHNVVKWGCGAKEARISQAAHWRPFYYLTTDERTGDLLRESLTSDLAAMKFDPMRVAQPVLPEDPKYPGRIRIGPDWFALVGNWMTEWERTGDVKWRDRILAGVDSILGMPYWIRTGQVNGLEPNLGGKIGRLKSAAMLMGYDPATGKLYPIPDPIAKEPVPANYNLSTIQGGAEVMFEVNPLLARDDWTKAWLQYCRLGSAPGEVLKQDQLTGNEGADARYVENAQGGPRLAAYAYARTKNPAFAQRAVAGLARRDPAANPQLISGADSLNPVHEALWVSTNDAAQSGLTAIEILELCADQLPNDMPPIPESPFGRGARGGDRGASQPKGPEAPPAAPPQK